MDDREDRLGSPRPPRILEEIASRLRNDAGVGVEPQFDVVKALWRLAKVPGPTYGLQIVPRSDEEMGNKEAWATSAPPTIAIRQARFVKPHDPDTRFILSHELFHAVLHPDGRSFRVVGGNAKLPFACKDDLLGIYHNDQFHEVQADVAARAFLMPKNFAQECRSAAHLAELCNVPLREAKLRFDQLRTKKNTPEEVKAYLAAQWKEEMSRLWGQLPIIPGEPPDQTRRAGIFRVSWNEFEMMTECGWTILNGRVVAYLDIHAGYLGR